VVANMHKNEMGFPKYSLYLQSEHTGEMQTALNANENQQRLLKT